MITDVLFRVPLHSAAVALAEKSEQSVYYYHLKWEATISSRFIEKKYETFPPLYVGTKVPGKGNFTTETISLCCSRCRERN